MNIKILITLAAAITLIIIWLTRITLLFKLVEELFKVKGKRKENLKQIFGVLKLIGLDMVFAVLSVSVLGSSHSEFTMQLILWVNALTTFFGAPISKFIIWQVKKATGQVS